MKLLNRCLRILKPAICFAVMLGLVLGGNYLQASRNSISAAGMIPLALVQYGNVDATTQQRILNARPAILIANTPAGVWHSGIKSATYQAAGIHVYSYIYANYDQYPLSGNQALIDAIAAEGTYGVFVDMVQPSATAYNQAIYSYAKSRGLSVIINPGMPYVDPSIYSVADYVMTDEHYTGRVPTSGEAGHLNQTIVIGFASGWTAQEAASYSNAAWANGFAYSWHEQIEYASLPTWFEQYISLLNPGTVSQEPVRALAAAPAPASAQTPAPTPTPAPAPEPTPVSEPQPVVGTGPVTGTVVSTPVPTGATNEYDLTLAITDSSDSRFSVGQQVWLAATTKDYPALLAVGAKVSGSLEHSRGWWVLQPALAPEPAPQASINTLGSLFAQLIAGLLSLF